MVYVSREGVILVLETGRGNDWMSQKECTRKRDERGGYPKDIE